MEKKMTKREVLNALLGVINYRNREEYDPEGLDIELGKISDELEAYALNEIDLLDKKASKAANYQSKTQKDNEGIMENILTALTTQDAPITVSELIKDSADLANFSNQKVSALLSKLVAENKVVKTVDKKKSYFAVAK